MSTPARFILGTLLLNIHFHIIDVFLGVNVERQRTDRSLQLGEPIIVQYIVAFSSSGS
jgi:hypothetical protein